MTVVPALVAPIIIGGFCDVVGPFELVGLVAAPPTSPGIPMLPPGMPPPGITGGVGLTPPAPGRPPTNPGGKPPTPMPGPNGVKPPIPTPNPPLS